MVQTKKGGQDALWPEKFCWPPGGTKLLHRERRKQPYIGAKGGGGGEKIKKNAVGHGKTWGYLRSAPGGDDSTRRVRGEKKRKRII